MKRIFFALLSVTGFALVGCSSTATPTQAATYVASDDDPGFMENYNIFKPVAISESGMHAWRYINPKFANHEYTAAILSSVKIYDPKFACQIPYATINGGQKMITAQATEALVKHKFALTTKPGTATLSLDMNVTGAMVYKSNGKLKNFVPLSTAITYAASEAIAAPSDYTAVVIVGGKATDTKSGLLVVGSYVAVPASNFVNKTATAAAFESALAPAVKLSLDNFVENK